MIHRCLQKLLAGLLLLALLCCWSGSVALGASRHRFYYFNPDSLQSNLGRLKRAMEDFLADAPFELGFQPFAHLVDFEQHVRDKRPAFLFVPHWYLKRYGSALHLRPLLIPTRHGSPHYFKVLLAGRDTKNGAALLQNKSLAMTTMGPAGGAILEDIFAAHGLKSGSLNPVIVPKDPDALFALALGQVDLALVTKDNMRQIAAINPNIMKNVRALFESAPIPMPVLCYMEGAVPAIDVTRLRQFFLEAGKNEEGRTMMEILEIDDWQTVSQ